MKYVLSAILIFMVTAGMSYAQTEELPIEFEKKDTPVQTPKKERSRVKHSQKYSKMLNSLVIQSSRFVSDENQKTELVEIRDEIVFSLAKKEIEYRKANSEVLNSLSKADFNASTAKKEFKKVQALQQSIFDQYLEGLSAIRKVIGNDNYNSLYTMTQGGDKKPNADGKKKKDEEEPKKAPENKPAEEKTVTE